MHLSLSTTRMSAAEKQQKQEGRAAFSSFITEKALQKLKSKATPHAVLFRSPCTVSRLCKHTAPMQQRQKKKNVEISGEFLVSSFMAAGGSVAEPLQSRKWLSHLVSLAWMCMCARVCVCV